MVASEIQNVLQIKEHFVAKPTLNHNAVPWVQIKQNELHGTK
jgi:hypothetical protein